MGSGKSMCMFECSMLAHKVLGEKEMKRKVAELQDPQDAAALSAH